MIPTGDGCSSWKRKKTTERKSSNYIIYKDKKFCIFSKMKQKKTYTAAVIS